MRWAWLVVLSWAVFTSSRCSDGAQWHEVRFNGKATVFGACGQYGPEDKRCDWVYDFVDAMNEANSRREWSKKTPQQKCEVNDSCKWSNGYCLCSSY